MSIWGKVVGGVAGFAVGGPIGALLGGIAGHVYDSKKVSDELGQTEPLDQIDQRQVMFTTAVIVLGAKMAKADGVVTKDEILAFREVFHVPPDEEQEVGRLFNEARQDPTGYEPYAEQIARLFASEPRVLEELLGALFYIAKSDGEIAAVELEFLRKTALIFGFTQSEFDRIRATHMPSPTQGPYDVLGLAKDADDATVKAKYRELVRENHPDRLMAQGMPQEFIDMANDKLAQINAAYDEIRKSRGI